MLNQYHNYDYGLVVDGVTKAFVKNGNGAWWKHWFKRNGNGNGHRKRIVAVNGVSLEIRRGEIFGILGPNGSGKSTLVRLISTLLVPDAGNIAVFGHDVEREEMAVKRLINRVSVDAAFFKKLSALENLMYAARLYGVSPRGAMEVSVEILSKLGIKQDRLTDPLEDMSRGMQQKVAIARAFLTAPNLLLLDEPTTGLDPRSKREVQAFVSEIRDTHDTTVLLMTHDMDEADKLCDRIAILDTGNIVAMGTPPQLKQLVPRRAPPTDAAVSSNNNGYEPTLEDVFMELTGKDLSEDAG